ncbi:exosome complex component RRP42 [Pseudoscourfieldia marina]
MPPLGASHGASLAIASSDCLGSLRRISSKVRLDGRSCLDFRFFDINLGAAPLMDGSCALKVSSAVAAIVTVRADVAPPRPIRPKSGAIEISVEFGAAALAATPQTGAHADPAAAAGGGAHANALPSSADMPTSRTDAVAARLAAALLPRGENGAQDCINLEALCVVPHKRVWWLYVHVHVVRDDLATTDVLMAGIYAALRNTSIPLVRVVESPDGEKAAHDDDDDNDAEREIELELVDDEVTPFAPEQSALLTTTVHSCGDVLYVDPTRDELMASEWHAMITTDRGGNACHVRTGGNLVNAQALADALAIAKRTNEQMRAHIDQLVDDAMSDE